jgi:hypothetical protein
MQVSMPTSGVGGELREVAAVVGRSGRKSALSNGVRHSTRNRRFVWLLIGVWVVNCFDLELTLLAAQQRMLSEVNPVVARLLPYGPKALTLYKFSLLAAGTAILWRFRSYRLATVALWVIAVACVAVSLVWYRLYFGPETAWGGIDTAVQVLGPPG